ncbi:MAG: threonine synthase [Oscillospiraceae bacterium]|nr:threonine synthase [Oscillospiraceae bacterium]
MRYVSTRGIGGSISGAEAILRGLADDGGLYVPEKMPILPLTYFEDMKAMDYPARAAYILKLFLPEFSDLDHICKAAYERFDGHPAPLVDYGEDLPLVLELWHGPTCAFKDMALQMLPLLMNKAREIAGEEREMCILTATSGDTGKAALEGFRDRQGTRVLVFYPQDGVSEIQKLQMITQEGSNVGVCGIRGNFDDAQTGVKQVFSDENFAKKLQGGFLSSANSINLGRLLPQIVYYVSAYIDFISENPGKTLNICVPTGNFGNILAALYAKEMGLPIGRLLCASNINCVLTELITFGHYNRNVSLHTTISPSMDILVSSNWERALHLLSGGNSEYVKECMLQLASSGRYELNSDCFNAMKLHFDARYCDDDYTKSCIAQVYERTQKIIDPHTAVAVSVLLEEEGFSQKDTPYMVVSTAHPGKFPEAVLSALSIEYNGNPIEALQGYTAIPAPLLGLEEKEKRFLSSVSPDAIFDVVEQFAN